MPGDNASAGRGRGGGSGGGGNTGGRGPSHGRGRGRGSSSGGRGGGQAQRRSGNKVTAQRAMPDRVASKLKTELKLIAAHVDVVFDDGDFNADADFSEDVFEQSSEPSDGGDGDEDDGGSAGMVPSEDECDHVEDHDEPIPLQLEVAPAHLMRCYRQWLIVFRMHLRCLKDAARNPVVPIPKCVSLLQMKDTSIVWFASEIKQTPPKVEGRIVTLDLSGRVQYKNPGVNRENIIDILF